MLPLKIDCISFFPFSNCLLIVIDILETHCLNVSFERQCCLRYIQILNSMSIGLLFFQVVLYLD